MRTFLVVAALAVLAAVACSGNNPAPTATAVPATATATPAPPPTVPAGGASNMLQLPNIADTVERVRSAVVSIVSEVITVDRFGRRQVGFSSGTGVIFDDSGLVLTNNHVIEGGVEITVTQDDGTQIVAEVVGADRLSDLAVLRLPGDGYRYLPLGTAGSLRVGDWVIAIGNALALPGGPTVTVGVVSALGRSIESSPGVTLYDLIQTDTSINPGNSGGPLIDLAGNLVGINTAVLRGGGGIPVEGIGFAIDIDTAQQVSQQLVELGRVRWAWMGVFLADLSPEVAAEVGLPIREGVIIRTTVIDGPSDRAGIQPGDIVVGIGGHDIATVSDLTRLLKQEFSAGQVLEVMVFRTANGAGNLETLTLELGERPQQ
ncbi:MAG: trypsin-like peptidase domain-containing protein [Chloroflexi bacterium]|nr:trypsin-like peptidase domain-containing protein [Chloroflexota bacterium]